MRKEIAQGRKAAAPVRTSPDTQPGRKWKQTGRHIRVARTDFTSSTTHGTADKVATVDPRARGWRTGEQVCCAAPCVPSLTPSDSLLLSAILCSTASVSTTPGAAT